jgi:hypothetical protein
MPETLATVDQVAARVGELITDSGDVLLAEACLEEASALVRFYGSTQWPDPTTAHPMAVTITIAAAARAYQNPGGFQTERADMVQLRRAAEFSVGAELTASEIAVLRAIGGGGGIVSAPLSNPEQIVPRSAWHGWYGNRGYTPVDYGDNKPFPWGWP